MKTDQVKGALQQAAGNTQAFLGELSGSERIELEGRARQSAGELQERYGKLLEQWGRVVKGRPLAILIAAAGTALALAWLIKRQRR